jgi:hypothetical protein
VTAKRKSAEEILAEAHQAESRDTLKAHRKTIDLLRSKGYSWREIAEFLSERGVEADHTKLFRFMKQVTMQSELLEVPAFVAYATALTALAASKNPPTKQQWRMLRHHYIVHNRTASYGQLAEAVDYKGNRGANAQYGIFGAKLGSILGMKFSKLDPKDPESPDFMSSSIGSESQFKNADGELQLVMHHELAKALDSLGTAWLDALCS